MQKDEKIVISDGIKRNIVKTEKGGQYGFWGSMNQQQLSMYVLKNFAINNKKKD